MVIPVLVLIGKQRKGAKSVRLRAAGGSLIPDFFRKPRSRFALHPSRRLDIFGMRWQT